MRLAGLILVLLLATGGAAGAATQDRIAEATVAGTVPVTPLGPDEVLLEVEVTGISHLPGETATVSVPVTRMGPTPAAARAALKAETDRIVAAVRRAGLAAAEMRILPREDPRVGLVGLDPDLVLAAEGSAAQARRHSATALVQLTLTDAGRYEAIRDAIETTETLVPAPVYALRDPERGRHEARADAVRRARAEAEDYAASLRMRVGRMVRLSSRVTPDQWIVTEMMRMGQPGTRPPTSVETRIDLSVDFALVPNR